jgi:hypothetical protein
MRNRAVLHHAITATLLGCASTAAAQIPAFPGADGAAAHVTGGRGGIVYHVTRTNSAIDDPQRNDPGTIRYGLNNANFPANTPRTIVFDVGGVFNLGRLPQPANGWDPNGNGWDAQSRLTIGGTSVTLAGQTAPGAGVIFMGGGLKPQGSNNIIRHITVASGYGLSGWWSPGSPHPAVPGSPEASTDHRQWFPDNTVYDAMDISGTNLMIDHVTTLFATDETISMNEVAHNITVQYSNIAQAQNYPQADAEGAGNLTGHAFGSLLSAGNTSTQAAISFHHNLYAHFKGRTPQIGDGRAGAYYDFRNNVFYNWMGTAGTKGGTTFLNLVNNFYLAGDGGENPVGGTNPGMTTAAGGTSVLGATSSIYRVGNLLDSNKDADANDGAALAAGGAASPLWIGGAPTYFGITDSAAVAYGRVLEYVGARFWDRNAPDARIVNEVETGTGKVIGWADDPWNSDPNEGAEWRALKNTAAVSRAANWDTELNNGYGQGDGMPTWWEIVHGLNPNARDDAGDFDADGYTNLEEYLNEIAEWPAPQPIVFTGATNSRYEQITNWNIQWQPSKYDEARIHSGAVTINSPGQHAGVLKIAPSVGDSATLTISAGWIDVAQRLEVASAGQVIMAGGQLIVPAVQLTGSAQLKLTPGGEKLLKLDMLTIAGDAKLDLADNRLIVTGQGVAAVEEAIAAAYRNSAWTGPGITTSMPAAAQGLTTLAVSTAQNLFGTAAGATTLWFGQVVQGDDVLVRYTYAGDANLDGLIDAQDYGIIDNWVQFPGTDGYANGDFNFDGIIDAVDYGIIDNSIQLQGDPFPNSASSTSPASVTAVPEPAACLFATITATYLSLARRRRRPRHHD